MPSAPIMHGYAWVKFISAEHAHEAKRYFEDELARKCWRCRFQELQVLEDNLKGNDAKQKQHPDDGWPLVWHEGQYEVHRIPSVGQDSAQPHGAALTTHRQLCLYV